VIVKKGDTVVFGKYAGTEVEIKNVKHLIVRESELLGVIERLTAHPTERQTAHAHRSR
jgi:chaperonin GroES